MCVSMGWVVQWVYRALLSCQSCEVRFWVTERVSSGRAKRANSERERVSKQGERSITHTHPCIDTRTYTHIHVSHLRAACVCSGPSILREHQTREPQSGEQRGEGFNRPTTEMHSHSSMAGRSVRRFRFPSWKAHTVFLPAWLTERTCAIFHVSWHMVGVASTQPAGVDYTVRRTTYTIYLYNAHLPAPARVSFLVSCSTSLSLSLSLSAAWLPAYCAHLFLSADHLFHSHYLTSLAIPWSSLSLSLSSFQSSQFFTVCLLFAFSVCRCVVSERMDR